MSSIEKLFGTHKQYKEFRLWCHENKKEALPYFYTWDTKDKEQHIVCLLPEEIDMWLLENCPIEWVINQIKEQYGLPT